MQTRNELLDLRVKEGEVKPEHQWEIDAVYNVENERVKQWLRERAQHAMKQPDAILHPNAVADANALLNAQEVKAVFGAPVDGLDPKLLAAAKNKEIEQEAPSRKLIQTYRILAWISLVLEFATSSAFALLGNLNPAVVLVAALLAILSFFAGLCLGALLALPKKGDQHVDPPETRRDRRRYLTLLVLLVTAILAVTYVRIGAWEGLLEGGFDVPVILTFVLALLATLFVALHHVHQTRYMRCLTDMYNCQRWYAFKRHAEDCESSKLYESVFRTEVDNLARGAQDALSRVKNEEKPK